MKRPPRKPRSGIFSRSDLFLALMQGLSVFATVLAVFIISIGEGVSEERIRSLTFTSLVIANVLLILINRSRTLTVWETLRRRQNRAIPWIIVGAFTLLLTLLYVPTIRDAFKVESLGITDFLLLVMVTMASVIWYEFLKVARRRAGH